MLQSWYLFIEMNGVYILVYICILIDLSPNFLPVVLVYRHHGPVLVYGSVDWCVCEVGVRVEENHNTQHTFQNLHQNESVVGMA